MTSVVRALLCVACLCALACDEDLPKATAIADMRLLGASVEVVGDPTRATPRPGEKVDVRFVTVHPSLATTNTQAQTMLVSCTQPNRYTGGIPVCEEFLAAAAGKRAAAEKALEFACQPNTRCGIACRDLLPPGTTRCDEGGNTCLLERSTTYPLLPPFLALRCIDGDPAARLRVSQAFTGEQMLYRGVVCERGQGYIDVTDPLLFGCDGNDGETTRVHGTVTIEHDDEDRNHNPDLSGARFFLGTPASDEAPPPEADADTERQVTTGMPWGFVPDDELPPEDACLGSVARCDAEAEDQSGVLCQYAYGRFRITLQYDPKLREKVDGVYEDLEFSVFATDGDLARRFLVFEGNHAPVPVRRPIACRDDTDCAGHAGAYCHALNCVQGQGAKRARVTEKAEVLQDTVDWKVPDELRGRSQLVRFFFTALDRRGGFAVTSRVLCLN